MTLKHPLNRIKKGHFFLKTCRFWPLIAILANHVQSQKTTPFSCFSGCACVHQQYSSAPRAKTKLSMPALHKLAIPESTYHVLYSRDLLINSCKERKIRISFLLCVHATIHSPLKSNLACPHPTNLRIRNPANRMLPLGTRLSNLHQVREVETKCPVYTNVLINLNNRHRSVFRRASLYDLIA